MLKILNLLKVLFFSSVLFIFISPIYSDEWADLEEGKKKEVYGSEKSKKYKMSNIFGEIESWDKHYAVRLFYIYDYTDYPKYSLTQFFPFYYRFNSKLDNREKFRFINYTSRIEKSQSDKSLLPLIFWGQNTQINSSYQMVLPFYYNASTANQQLDKKDLMIFPITYFYFYENKKENSFFKESHYSLLHGRSIQKNKISNQFLENSYWFPAIPIIRYTSSENSFFHYVFPIYGYSESETPKKEETKFLFSLFPFYYANSSYIIEGKNRHRDLTHWTLFHYRSVEEDKGGFREYTHKSVWGFPLLPFLYYSAFKQGDGNYKRILTLFHWQTNETDELDAISVLPFFYYKKKDFLRIPILFIDKDLSAPTASYGRTFIPLILYYNKWDPTSHTTVFGPWVSLENKIKNETFQTAFPIYWKSQSEKRDLTLVLPFYANYNDKESDYHFNLLWFTKSNTGAVNPGLSLGKKEDKWYLDTDLTVLYYLANISYRQLIEKPKFLRNVLDRNKSFEEIEKEKKEELAAQKKAVSKQDNSPKITKKKTISREDSYNFMGYSLLFGLLSYEAADSKRHFRLLPLSWLSWDKDSDDKVYVAPLFLWYQSDLLEYFVLFPLYGKQKDESSEKKVFLINAYIQESYKEKNWQESSVVWPLINWYTSDERQGHRFLPFYIHQNYKSQNRDKTKNYTLFSYFEKEVNQDYSSESFFFWPALTYYESNKYKLDNKNDKEFTGSKYKLYVTPFFYRNKTLESTHTNFLWFIDFSFYKNTLSRGIVFPFYYFSDGNFGIFPLSLNNTNNKFWTFTLLNYLKIYNDEFYYNFLFLVEIEKKPKNFESNFLLYAIQYKKSESEFSLNGLWGYAWNFNKTSEKWNEANIFWYLGGGYRTNGENSIYNLSLLFYYATNGKDYQNWLLGNYTRKSSQGFRNNFLYLVDYEDFTPDGSYTWDFLFTTIRYYNLKNEKFFQAGYGYIWNFRKENELWSDATFLWLGYSKSANETVYNFLPLIRTYDSQNENSRIYGPLLLYTSEESGKNFHLGLFGLGYWYRKDPQNKEEDTYILLGTLYREYTEKERGFRARGSFWGLLWDYQKEEETSFEKFSILKFFSYSTEADGTKKIMGISL